MMDMGYPLHLIDLLAKLYKKQLAQVKVAGTLERSVRSADRSTISTASVVSTRPLPAARQRHVGLPLRSSSSRLSTPDRCGIKSTHRHHIRALLLIDTFKVALKTLYLFDYS